MNSKVAIVILSNPQQGEEALGKVFNALVMALDLKKRNKDIRIFFQGTGTRWIVELSKESHPANSLYTSLKDKISGVSSACATVFGAAEEVKACGIPLLSEFDIPGLGGATSLAKYQEEGYNIITF